MLTKQDVIETVSYYYENQGYQLIEGSADIVAKKDTLVKVIAYGAVSDPGHTSKVGKGYNKNQIRMNIGLALYEIMKLMDDSSQFVIALPEHKIYDKLIKEVKDGLKAHHIEVILVNEQGFVKHV